ncbi:MAG: hypothetical protein KKH44_03170, partial [Bacteroidetes bacterium]|nr:hypothetical protein [Bacteroidota bacterium]
MGRTKLGLKRVEFKNFSKGYFPNLDLDDVPDGGSNNCSHVIWNRSKLRKMFGMDLHSTSQVSELHGLGLHYLDTNTLKYRLAVFGTKLYYDASGTWTNITGTITLTDGALCQFIDHQIGANEFVIGVNGTDAPFKWIGTGNASVLLGSPPNFTSIAKFNGTYFGSVGQYVYFSDLEDPETWDLSKWVITMSKDVVRVIDNKGSLAVLKSDSIGSIEGYTYLDFSKTETTINSFGCVGKMAACNAKFGETETDVIAVLAYDGLHIVDASYNDNHVFGKDWMPEFSTTNLSKSVLTYDKTEKLLYCAIPYGTETENDYLVVVDMFSGAFWPMPKIHTNYIKAIASCKDDSLNEYVYFIDNAGFSFKFNRNIKNYHSGVETEAIPSFWNSHKYDFQDIIEIREAVALASSDSDSYFTFGLSFGANLSTTIYGSVYTEIDADFLDISFDLDFSTLSESTYFYNLIPETYGFGRYISFFLNNEEIDQGFEIFK